jgi:hypothetical protein
VVISYPVGNYNFQSTDMSNLDGQTAMVLSRYDRYHFMVQPVGTDMRVRLHHERLIVGDGNG